MQVDRKPAGNPTRAESKFDFVALTPLFVGRTWYSCPEVSAQASGRGLQASGSDPQGQPLAFPSVFILQYRNGLWCYEEEIYDVRASVRVKDQFRAGRR